MVIQLLPGAGLSSNPSALAAFERAAAAWESLLADPITVTVSANLANLGSGSIIGQTSTVLLQGSYSLIRNQLAADAAGTPAAAIENALPSQPLFRAPAGFTVSGNLLGAKADLKAMGFAGLDAAFGANDATMTFNSGFTFDFNNADGVAPGQMDFESVAVHEIGHVLGFISSVDNVDGKTSGTITPSVLDLFRFDTAAIPANLIEFSTFERSLRAGGASSFADTRATYSFSTGFTSGDGRQASHWKDDVSTGLYIGIMDPTLSYSTVERITTADLRAMQDIGYDLAAPEPGTWLLVLAGTAILWRRRIQKI